jgi:hypothetical protein
LKTVEEYISELEEELDSIIQKSEKLRKGRAEFSLRKG